MAGGMSAGSDISLEWGDQGAGGRLSTEKFWGSDDRI